MVQSLYLTLTLFIIFGISNCRADSIPVVYNTTSQSVPQSLPQSLKDAFLAAIHRSETIGLQEELIVQAHEVGNQAIGAVLPNITGTGTFMRQENPHNAIGGAIFPPTQNTGKLTITQPLFQGLRDFATLRQKKYLEDSQIFALFDAARQLFYSVSTAYYNVLAYHRDEVNYLKQVKVYKERLSELESFFKIGRAQKTDVLTFKSSLLALEVQLEAVRGQHETAKDVLAYLTGWNRDTPLEDNESFTTFPAVSTYLDRIEERPDVQLAAENVKAYEEGVPIAFGAHLPQINAIGDYYFFRPGAVSAVHWDAQIALTVPIFSGGIVQSQVRQANAIARQYRLTLSQVRRLAEQEIRTFYNSVEADRKQLQKLEELVVVGGKSFETEVKYFRNGLVTNLDVLTAVTTYQDAIRQRDHMRYQLHADSTKLQAAAAERTEVHVQAPKR